MEFLFTKHYDGSEQPNNALLVNSEREVVLLYGQGEDELGKFRWQRDYDHVPTSAELRSDIEALVNALTEEKIRTGMRYEGKPIWLSEENQMNFRGLVPPMPFRYKVGENENGDPVYMEFYDENNLAAFCRAMSEHIYGCLQKGWEEKDGIDNAVALMMQQTEQN